MEVPLSQVCKSQDSAGEIGTVLWAGKRSLQDGLSAGDGPQNYTTFSRRILGFTSTALAVVVRRGRFLFLFLRCLRDLPLVVVAWFAAVRAWCVSS